MSGNFIPDDISTHVVFTCETLQSLCDSVQFHDKFVDSMQFIPENVHKELERLEWD